MFSFLLFFLSFLLGFWTHSAQAEEGAVPSVDFSVLPASAMVAQSDRSGTPHPVVARLLLDSEQVQIGKAFRLGVHLTMLPEWHTYWRSPGGVGKKTEITWKGPEQTKFSPYVFPVPHRYFDGASVSYGYSDQVLLYTDVVLPEGASGDIELSAQVRWLVCKTSCIMGNADLSTVVRIGSDTKASSFSVLFDHYAAQHPTPITNIEGIEVEYGLSVDKLHSEEKFAFVASIKPKEGIPLVVETEEGASTWPYVTPIFEGTLDAQYDEQGILPEVTLTKTADSTYFV